MYLVGIDLGGTKIEGVVLDEALKEVHRKRIATPSEKGYDAILQNIKGLYDDLIAKIDGAPHSLGIGTPGSISSATGALKNSNTICMNGKPVRKDLTALLGREFEMHNDANC